MLQEQIKSERKMLLQNFHEIENCLSQAFLSCIHVQEYARKR